MNEPARGNRNSRWGNRILVVLFTMVVAPLGLTLLYTHYNPTGENAYFPGCFFKEWTNLHCPVCGATRCLYAILHLDIEQALAWNPLFVILMPFLVFGALRTMYTMWTGKTAPGYRLPAWATKYLLGLILAYWILRNIPVYPLTLLAPHLLS